MVDAKADVNPDTETEEKGAEASALETEEKGAVLESALNEVAASVTAKNLQAALETEEKDREILPLVESVPEMPT
jgi:hypothetical protein